MRKILVRILSCSLILTMLLGLNVMPYAQNEKKGEIPVLFRQIIALPYDFDSEVLESSIEVAGYTGWSYNSTEHQFERYVEYPNIEVTVLEEAVHSGEKNMTSNSQESVTICIHDLDNKKTYIQKVKSKKSKMPVVVDLDVSDMIAVDNSTMTKLQKFDFMPMASYTDPYWSVGEEGVAGYRLHCNRFNGYKGDGKYYPNHYPQAITNFFASDCDWALGRSTKCLADYGDNPFCAASPAEKQASCSTLIGHYSRFHMHSGFEE